VGGTSTRKDVRTRTKTVEALKTIGNVDSGRQRKIVGSRKNGLPERAGQENKTTKAAVHKPKSEKKKDTPKKGAKKQPDEKKPYGGTSGAKKTRRESQSRVQEVGVPRLGRREKPENIFR